MVFLYNDVTVSRESCGHQSRTNVTGYLLAKYRHHLLCFSGWNFKGCSADHLIRWWLTIVSIQHILHHNCVKAMVKIHPPGSKAPSSFPASSRTVAAVVNGLPPTISAKTKANHQLSILKHTLWNQLRSHRPIFLSLSQLRDLQSITQQTWLVMFLDLLWSCIWPKRVFHFLHTQLYLFPNARIIWKRFTLSNVTFLIWHLAIKKWHLSLDKMPSHLL